MKIAQMGGDKGVGVAEVADPVVADNYARIKVYSSPLCTEFKGLGRERRGGGDDGRGVQVHRPGQRGAQRADDFTSLSTPL